MATLSSLSPLSLLNVAPTAAASSWPEAAVVLDQGSGFIKAGVAGTDIEDVLVVPSIVGRPKVPRVLHCSSNVSTCSVISQHHTNLPLVSPSNGPLDVFLANDAIRHQGVLSLSYPAAWPYGTTDWDALSCLWRLTYQLLDVAAEERPLLVSEPPLCLAKDREKLASIFFEELNVPALFVSVQGALALYASGRDNGVVLDCGDCLTSAVPVCNGGVVAGGVISLPFGGRTLSGFLGQLMMEKGDWYPQTSSEKRILAELMERFCYVALDFDLEEARNPAEIESSYHLPDGQLLHLEKERFRCPELLFRPELHCEKSNSVDGQSSRPQGLVDILFDSVNRTSSGDIDGSGDAARDPSRIRATLLNSVVLAGGTSMLSGFPLRLQLEMSRRLAHETQTSVGLLRPRIVAPPHRKFSVWRGGSILASLTSFQRLWIDRNEYEESGPDIVNRRCF